MTQNVRECVCTLQSARNFPWILSHTHITNISLFYINFPWVATKYWMKALESAAGTFASTPYTQPHSSMSWCLHVVRSTLSQNFQLPGWNFFFNWNAPSSQASNLESWGSSINSDLTINDGSSARKNETMKVYNLVWTAVVHWTSMNVLQLCL